MRRGRSTPARSADAARVNNYGSLALDRTGPGKIPLKLSPKTRFRSSIGCRWRVWAVLDPPRMAMQSDTARSLQRRSHAGAAALGEDGRERRRRDERTRDRMASSKAASPATVRRLIVGISGASGTAYGVAALRVLRE